MVPTLGSLAGIELHDHQERNPTDQVCASVKTRQITGRHSSRSTRVLPSRANTKPAPGSLSAAHLDQRVRCECEHLAVQLTTEKLFSSKSPPPPRTHSHTRGTQLAQTQPQQKTPSARWGLGLARGTCTPRKKKENHRQPAGRQVTRMAGSFPQQHFREPSLCLYLPLRTRKHKAYSHANPAHPSLVLPGAALHMTWGQHSHGLFWKDKYSEARHLTLPFSWTGTCPK